MGCLKNKNTKSAIVVKKRKIDKSFHDELCTASVRWLLKTVGAGVAVSEMACCNMTGEIPDAIGWKQGCSILIEAKTSRPDFLADKKKHFRISPEFGMGSYRLFICPDGLIKPDELPKDWGLLYYHPGRKRRIERVICFKGNIVSNEGNLKSQVANYRAENALLLSYIRRNK